MIQQIRVMATTSLRQGQTREGMSEGSQRQICEPTNRNILEGRASCGKLAKHNKAFGSGGTVNDAAVQGQFTFLSGEICSNGGLLIYGSLTEVYLETGRKTTEP
ncbi:hypothetical protein NDI52_28085 [Leptolyngbya sp. PL-A3]|uniref:hypothetical protein n=1 Tax=Leptolyngbya sp. PL-A3 TaxID=2933911 RepID=UPI00329A0A82